MARTAPFRAGRSAESGNRSAIRAAATQEYQQEVGDVLRRSAAIATTRLIHQGRAASWWRRCLLRR